MVLVDVNLPTCHSTAVAPSSLSHALSKPSASSLLGGPPAPSFSATSITTPRNAIFSVDMHPSGRRYATGGSDNKVKVWSSSGLFILRRTAPPSGGKAKHGTGKAASAPALGAPDGALDVKGYESAGLSDGAAAAAENFTSASATAPPSFLLASMASHEGSVMCVKWSNNGRYLASASDDTFVMIYSLRASSSSAAFGQQQPSAEEASSKLPAASGGGPKAEHWTRIRVLRGHALDVIDLCWSPNDLHLVSCSLDKDSPVIVWRPNLSLSDTGQASSVVSPFRVLGVQHNLSAVKGVAFDPLGSYLITSSEDPALHVWRANADWGLEHSLTSSNSCIFQSLDGTSHRASVSADNSLVRRLSFMSDGAALFASAAVVRSKNVAAIVRRESLAGGAVGKGGGADGDEDASTTLVGHKSTVGVCRANPVLFRREKRRDDEDSEGQYQTLVALGDKSGFVTVWSNIQAKPIFKAQVSAQHQAITDLSWSPDGTTLLASCFDGFMTAFKFEVAEISAGGALSPKEKDDVFRTKYGVDMDTIRGVSADSYQQLGNGRQTRAGGAAANLLVENTAQLDMEERYKSKVASSSSSAAAAAAAAPSLQSTTGNQPRKAGSAPTTLDSAATLALQQVTTDRKTGKKRIVPVLVAEDGAVGIDPMVLDMLETGKAAGGGGGKATSDDSSNKSATSQGGSNANGSKAQNLEKMMSGGGKEGIESSFSAAQQQPPAPKAASGPSSVADKVLSVDGEVKEQLKKKRKVVKPSAVGTGASGGAGGGSTSAGGALQSSAGASSTGGGLTPAGGAGNSNTSSKAALLPGLSANAAGGGGGGGNNYYVATDGYPHLKLPVSKNNSFSSELVAAKRSGDNIGGGDISGGDLSPPTVVTVVNNTASTSVTLTITCGGKVLHVDEIAGCAASCLCACGELVAVGSRAGEVYVWRAGSGGWAGGGVLGTRRFMPPMALGGGGVSGCRLFQYTDGVGGSGGANARGGKENVRLMVILSDGDIGVWDLGKRTLTGKINVRGAMRVLDSAGVVAGQESAAGGNNVGLVRAFLEPAARASNGEPLVMVLLQKAGAIGGPLQGFMADFAMDAWFRVADGRFALSDYTSTAASLPDGVGGGGVLSKIEGYVAGSVGLRASQILAPRAFVAGGAGVGAAMSVVLNRSYLEDRLACSVACRSAVEYKKWLVEYVRFLADCGEGDAIRCLCLELCGDGSASAAWEGNASRGTAEPKPWYGSDFEAVGLKGMDLLRDVVLVELGGNRALQRVTNEFKSICDML